MDVLLPDSSVQDAKSALEFLSHFIEGIVVFSFQ